MQGRLDANDDSNLTNSPLRSNVGMDDDLVRIELWAEGDLPLLEGLLGDPAMTTYLGGPESAEKLTERHAKYLAHQDPGDGPALRIVHVPTGEAVGWVGYWESTWQDEKVYEIGWSVLPGFQGRGIGAAATALAIEMARTKGRHRYMHAFPSVENGASNAICRKLGFTLLGPVTIEYPPGTWASCNDWQLDLQSGDC
jgi:RimJ/RimL family protein N-acetyltransferase